MNLDQQMVDNATSALAARNDTVRGRQAPTGRARLPKQGNDNSARDAIMRRLAGLK